MPRLSPYRFKGLTPNETAVLADYAQGKREGHHARTVHSLAHKGYLVGYFVRDQKIHQRFIEYFIPWQVHQRLEEWQRAVKTRMGKR